MLPLLLPLPRVYVCLGFALLALATDSRADAVLIRFAPSSGPVAGYKLWYAPQTTGAITTAPVDIGMRSPDSTGAASYTLSGLDPNRPYSFELSAYDANGNQSAHSNRLTLDPRTEALGALLWSSNFDAYAAGVHAPAFVDESDDERTATGRDLFQVAYVNGNAAFGTSASSGLVSTRFVGGTAPSWGSYELSGRVWTSAKLVGAGLAVHDTGERPDQFFGLVQTTMGAWVLSAPGEPALTCANSTATGVQQPASTWYSFRMRVTEPGGLTRVRAMIWSQSGTQPGSWQVDCWTKLPVSGDSGAFALRRSFTSSAYFDDLAVTSVIGTLAPIPQ
ncbi:MAG TPA: fibronectin type III domain-containing protein [Myxococcota bacterium]|nr:fibronectin type III domain-containing protein [Myxococcota bacterium]